MSQQLPNLPWIHIGECPFCVNGLCRIRFCDHLQGPHLFAMCDECEAMWLQPTTESPKQFPDAEQPQCPICDGPLYGPDTRWAEPQDVADTVWHAAAIYDVPSTEPTVEDFLTPEDYVGELDVPAIPESGLSGHGDHRDRLPDEPPLTIADMPPTAEPDIAYGDDEPRPGC